MLQELISDQNLLFFTFHAFIIGASIGYFIAYSAIKNFRKQLKNQAKAYDELMESMHASSGMRKSTEKGLHVIRMNTNNKKVSGYAF
jgi:uncharacterized protein YneF (UPF0154 family)